MKNDSKLQDLISEEVKKQFGIPPKMGDIDASTQPDSERPGMTNRPDDGMDIKQHKTMMWINENAQKALPSALKEFCEYAQKALGFDQPVTVRLRKDEDNAENLLGFTGHYSPSKKEVVVYTSGRHPKDVLRSVSHELVHHMQNCRGDFAEDLGLEEGYAQTDPHLRKMEEEAFQTGNIIFRDWCDHMKEQTQTMLDEVNAIGSGAVVGYTGPLGMDTAPGHAMMWSGDEPNSKKKSNNNKLNEAAKSIEQLTPSTKVHIKQKGTSFEITIEDGEEIVGRISAHVPNDPASQCGPAYIIKYSTATKGFGPLMYDLALEMAGPRGLTSDREVVSPDASNVWKYYYNNRSDVEKELIDPDKCLNQASKETDEYVTTWKKSLFAFLSKNKVKRPWLNYIYYVTSKEKLNSLKSAGKLKLNESKHVIIYRALPVSAETIRPDDYITLSKKFAIEHAVTSAIYHDEPFKVVMKSVSTSDIAAAQNPGEYLWKGKEVPARAVSMIDTDGNVERAPIHEERIKKTKYGADLFQMGSSLPDELYNRKNKTPSRDPGIAGKHKPKKREKAHLKEFAAKQLEALITDWDKINASEGVSELQSAIGHTAYGIVAPRDAKESDWVQGKINISRVKTSGVDREKAQRYARTLKDELLHGSIDPIFVELIETWSDYNMDYSYNTEVLDGNHRVVAARILGLSELPGFVVLPKDTLDNLENVNEAYYHGSSKMLKPGDYVLPPTETGEVSEKGRKKNLNKVFFTKDVGSARIYAGRAKHSLGGDPAIYVIEPEGNIELINAQPGTTVFSAPRAKVIKKL